ncbi:hypothetical protein AgCh_000441 [Apium graveolens]
MVSDCSSICADDFLAFDALSDMAKSDAFHVDKNSNNTESISKPTDFIESIVIEVVVKDSFAVTLGTEDSLENVPDCKQGAVIVQLPPEQASSGSAVRSVFEVANYFQERFHIALDEELDLLMAILSHGSTIVDCQEQWKHAFFDTFLKVDTEIGEGANVTPLAPENVGSTAAVAIVCSSHIIVANCGDSRVVLCRGKESLALFQFFEKHLQERQCY